MSENLQKIVEGEASALRSGMIPQEATLFEGKSLLDPAVAIARRLPEIENRKVVFSFRHYEQNKCELMSLQKRDAKQLTEVLGKVNDATVKQIRTHTIPGVASRRISGTGNYASLYDHVPKDVELKEIDYTNTGRIFGYIVEDLFHVTAIKKKHIKYD